MCMFSLSRSHRPTSAAYGNSERYSDIPMSEDISWYRYWVTGILYFYYMWFEKALSEVINVIEKLFFSLSCHAWLARSLCFNGKVWNCLNTIDCDEMGSAVPFIHLHLLHHHSATREDGELEFKLRFFGRCESFENGISTVFYLVFWQNFQKVLSLLAEVEASIFESINWSMTYGRQGKGEQWQNEAEKN